MVAHVKKFPAYVERAVEQLRAYFRRRRMRAEFKVGRIWPLSLYRIDFKVTGWKSLPWSRRQVIAESVAFRNLNDRQRMRLFVRAFSTEFRGRL